MRKIRQIFIFAFSVFLFSIAVNAQQIGPSYGFLEVVDFKNEPVPDASVLGGGSAEKTDRNGLIEKGIRIDNSLETSFSIEKAGFFTFTDYYGLFDFLRNLWRNNRENPIKIELLKIPENKAERKINGKQQEMREFFGAARRGDAVAVRKFIKSGLSPTLTTSDLRGIPTEKDIPIIIYAAKSGNGAAVKEFLSAGVNLHAKNEQLQKVLPVYLDSYFYYDTSRKKYPETESEKREIQVLYEDGAENLIKAGANVNSGALPIAIRKGYLRTVKNLVAKGASLDAPDFDYLGYTALHTAVESGNREIVEFLLEKGAKLNVLASYAHSDSFYCGTPLMFAIRYENSELINFLLAKKADPNLMCKDGKTALRMAMKSRNYKLFNQLIEAGADVKAIDEAGTTNLMYAVGDVVLVKKMIEAGIPVNARNKEGLTALMIAAKNPYLDMLETMNLLLEAKADPNTTNEQKFRNYYNNEEIQKCETPLILITDYYDPKYYGEIPSKMIELLTAKGANVNYTCENGENPVKRAVRGLRIEGLKKLIQLGADVKGEKGKEVLAYAEKLAETNYYKMDENPDKLKEIIEIIKAEIEK